MAKKYEISNIDITEHSTGLSIRWCAKGIGFGCLEWGVRDGHWVSDIECMSTAFIEAVLIAAAPQLAKLIAAKDGSMVYRENPSLEDGSFEEEQKTK